MQVSQLGDTNASEGQTQNAEGWTQNNEGWTQNTDGKNQHSRGGFKTQRATENIEGGWAPNYNISMVNYNLTHCKGRIIYIYI